MEQQFEEEARKQIEQVLNKMQHVYHVDVGVLAMSSASNIRKYGKSAGELG